VCSLMKHVLPKLTRAEIAASVTGMKVCSTSSLWHSLLSHGHGSLAATTAFSTSSRARTCWNILNILLKWALIWSAHREQLLMSPRRAQVTHLIMIVCGVFVHIKLCVLCVFVWKFLHKRVLSLSLSVSLFLSLSSCLSLSPPCMYTERAMWCCSWR
jgi:hypothetical protein